MIIIEQNHTRNPLNGSILVSLVFSIDHSLFERSEDDFGALKAEITNFLDDLSIKISLINVEHYRSSSIVIDRSIITLMCQDGLKSNEYFTLVARLHQASTENGFKYKVQLSPLKSTYQTRSNAVLSNSKNLMTSLFSNNKSIVKVLQAHKQQLDPSNPQITKDQLVQLLIQLIEIYSATDQEITEDELMEVLQSFTSLNDLVTRSLNKI